MSKQKQRDVDWLQRHFPSPQARDVADKTMDDIPVTEPMSTYLDRWIQAYIKAGGRTDLKLD
jgi:hypothetical protein